MKQKILYYTGNLLILSAVGLLVFTFYPVVVLYLFPKQLSKTIPSGFVIQIPKISAEAQVIKDVDPWDEKVYSKTLQKGVAHAKSTALPGEKDMMFLFAHSSAAPWETTRANTAFLRLSELNRGDEIKIYYKNKKYVYKVTDKKEVWPNEVSYLTQRKDNILILQTCTPIGTSLKRLLVFAK